MDIKEISEERVVEERVVIEEVVDKDRGAVMQKKLVQHEPGDLKPVGACPSRVFLLLIVNARKRGLPNST